MSAHSHHPPIRTHGLADDCDRCSEIAEWPIIHLDDDNLVIYIGRVARWREDNPDSFPRSDNEAKAMRYLERSWVEHQRLVAVAQGMFP